MHDTSNGSAAPLWIGAAVLLLCGGGNAFTISNTAMFGAQFWWAQGVLYGIIAFAVAIIPIAAARKGWPWAAVFAFPIVFFMCGVLDYMASTANQDKRAAEREVQHAIYIDAVKRKIAAERVLESVEGEVRPVKTLAAMVASAETAEREAKERTEACAPSYKDRCQELAGATTRATTALATLRDHLARAEARDAARIDKQEAMRDIAKGRDFTSTLAASLADMWGASGLVMETPSELERRVQNWGRGIENTLSLLGVFAALTLSSLGGWGFELVQEGLRLRRDEKEEAKRNALQQELLRPAPTNSASLQLTRLEPNDVDRAVLQLVVEMLQENNGRYATTVRELAQLIERPKSTVEGALKRIGESQDRILVTTSKKGTVFQLLEA